MADPSNADFILRLGGSRHATKNLDERSNLLPYLSLYFPQKPNTKSGGSEVVDINDIAWLKWRHWPN